MNKAQHTTSCIVHLADSANFKGGTSNKRCSGLTGSCLEMPNDTIHVTVVQHAEKATAQIAHLVSANTQSQHRKTKRAILS